MFPDAKLAFLGDEITYWIGGIDFLRLCAGGIQAVTQEREMDILLPAKGAKRTLLHTAVTAKREVLYWMRIQRPTSLIPSREHVIDSLTSIGHDLRVIDCPRSSKGMARIMQQHKIGCIFPCLHSLGSGFPYGWIGYIADLQHKRLPLYFSEQERRQRDKTFQSLLRDAKAIVVNARNVIEDIEEFYPDHRAKLFALPFCPPIHVLKDISDEELTKYCLPSKYFLVSNQFWVHKSHKTIFEALQLLRDENYNVHVVCTGNQHDYRKPYYFRELQQYIQQNGLADRIHFLGVIPKKEQLAIMRRSMALIQPTLFEGGPGGGAVYDAVSVGIPAIVSDIPVNREIDIGTITFFRAGSAEDLANKMICSLKNLPERMAPETMQSLLATCQRKMGEVLMRALDCALSNH
jgi:glycosyltransferase involved in cell wall biosynthesis